MSGPNHGSRGGGRGRVCGHRVQVLKMLWDAGSSVRCVRRSELLLACEVGVSPRNDFIDRCHSQVRTRNKTTTQRFPRPTPSQTQSTFLRPPDVSARRNFTYVSTAKVSAQTLFTDVAFSGRCRRQRENTDDQSSLGAFARKTRCVFPSCVSVNL